LVRRSDELGLLITRIPRQAIAEMQVAAGSHIDEVNFSLARGGVTDVYRLPLAHDAAQAWSSIWAKG